MADVLPNAFAADFAALNHWTVTTDWLYNHLTHSHRVPDRGPQIVIVDCRFALADPLLGRQQYEASHLPGAYYLDLNQDLSSPVQAHGGRHPLPQPEILAAKLTAMGVSSANPPLVVVYDDSRFAFAARLWWLLRYYGHDQVVVLDGGYSQWLEAGYPVTTELPALSEQRSEELSGQPASQALPPFIPQIRSDWTVDIMALKQALSAVFPAPLVLIDSREAERYRGEREPIDPVAGHIPGALNYAWQDVTDAQGVAQPLAVQQQRWATLPDASEPVVYCGSGVTACVNLLSLAIAGRAAKLYPGSWSDWCSYL